MVIKNILSEETDRTTFELASYPVKCVFFNSIRIKLDVKKIDEHDLYQSVLNNAWFGDFVSVSHSKKTCLYPSDVHDRLF